MSRIYTQNLLVKPSNLPLILKEVKDYLRITYDNDDQMLNQMISSASLAFQNYTSQALIYQTWEVTYRQLGKISINLPIRPLVDVVKIELISNTGEYSLYPIENIDIDRFATEIIFNIYPNAYSLKIVYIAGYGFSADDIPPDIKIALLSHIAHMYEIRSIVSDYKYKIYDEFKTMRL